MDIQKKQEYIILYEYYKKLLTKKQREYFSLYFYEDYSLSEVANFKNISRNAIYDSLKKIIRMMDKLEKDLLLKYKQELREKLYEKYKNKLEKNFFIELQKIDDLDEGNS